MPSGTTLRPAPPVPPRAIRHALPDGGLFFRGLLIGLALSIPLDAALGYGVYRLATALLP